MGDSDADVMSDDAVCGLAVGIADQLIEVPGVVGVVLGGSRARGAHLPSSDVDLGIYYERQFDVAALRRLAARLDPSAEITDPAGWGRWVDGGGWLRIEGVAVDWIYRELARVEQQAARALRGEFEFHQQVGHPLGFLDVSYAGELGCARMLADPSGRLAAISRRLDPYPSALRRSLSDLGWEASFCLDIAAKGAARGDTPYVALCLSRSLLLCGHVICARDGRWVLNEKGLIAAAADLPGAPDEFQQRAADVLSDLTADPERLAHAVRACRSIVDQVSGR